MMGFFQCSETNLGIMLTLYPTQRLISLSVVTDVVVDAHAAGVGVVVDVVVDDVGVGFDAAADSAAIRLEFNASLKHQSNIDFDSND